MQTNLWISAVALALGGGVWYLLDQSDLAWWLAGAAVLPFMWLIMDRQDRLDAENEPHYGNGGDRAWGPPPDGGPGGC